MGHANTLSPGVPRPGLTPALPLGAGISLKPLHYTDVLSAAAAPDFLEIHAENYFCEGGPAHHYLEAIRQEHRLSIHGVGLSLGGPDPPSIEALKSRRQLLDRYQPDEFSEHLAWSEWDGRYFNDLLPVAYTQQSLQRVAAHIDQVQNALGRRILIENPATYLQFESSSLSETDFLRDLVHLSGCGLLLDLNNVIVSAVNHGFDAQDYLRGFPLEAVGEVHLAGHQRQIDRDGRELLIDSHDGPVSENLWSLYTLLLQWVGPQPTLIEWDQKLPSFTTLKGEARRAKQLLQEHQHAAA